MAELTDRSLRKKWTGKDEWLSDGGSRGAGRLVAKLAAPGVTFYFQYYQGSRRRFMPIGGYDAKAERGVTLLQARDQAHAWSVLLRQGVTDLHGFQEDLEKERRRQRDEAAALEQTKIQEAKHASLGQLLDAYVGHLQRLEKQSATDVRILFDVHVIRAEPELVARKASELDVDEFVGLLSKLVQAGKGRTAEKLRSYLRAAYGLALQSKTNPDAPQALRNFGVRVNPIASISALSKYNRPRERVLSAEELSRFLKRLLALPDSIKRDALLLVLYLGGQRPAQLLRARLVDLDLSARTLTLYDPKGARTQPRTHVLPLTQSAQGILERIAKRASSFQADEKGRSQPLFSSNGKQLLRIETVSAQVTEIARAMLEAGELRERFELRDLRRSAETMLASLGVSKDTRAQLQSHGLGGVQSRHYDRYSYLSEKQSALEIWERHLNDLLEP